jgi:Fe-S cluster assembly protein SufB
MSSEIELLVNKDYRYGFSTDIEVDSLPPGLSEDVVRAISERKREPGWMLDWRLQMGRPQR